MGPLKKIKLEKSFSSEVEPQIPQSSDMSQEAEKAVHKQKKSLSYSNFGISEFTSSTVGFNCIVKNRAEDFIVNEVDLLGNTVSLTELTYKPAPDDNLKKQDRNLDVETGNLDSLASLLNDDSIISRLKRLVESADQDEEILTKPILDKSARTSVHKIIAAHFDVLESKTEADSISIRYVPKTGNKRKRRDNRIQGEKFDPNLEYCLFHLYKENKDTMEALGIIGRLMKADSKAFSFAGTKDKRAITVQQVTGYRLRPEKLQSINGDLRGMKVGNFRFVSNGLNLGSLAGNRFCLTLRDVQSSEENLNESLEALKTHGFINYYGLQRFGTRSVSTHEVGQAILAEDYSLAVDLILKPKENEREDFVAARKHWQEHHDPAEALNLFPKSCVAERSIMSEFSRNGVNNVAGLNAIPRNLRLIYVHAYQSFVWNHMVSKRIKDYGLSVVVGDLIQIDKDLEEITEKNIKIVTEEEIQNYKIEDVVLPLHGHSVLYPTNGLKDNYRKFLFENGGLDIDNLKRQ
ncbi:hypothetical protein HK096_007383, partial [Nowakowskiella sp. JEL0078]